MKSTTRLAVTAAVAILELTACSKPKGRAINPAAWDGIAKELQPAVASQIGSGAVVTPIGRTETGYPCGFARAGNTEYFVMLDGQYLSRVDTRSDAFSFIGGLCSLTKDTPASSPNALAMIGRSQEGSSAPVAAAPEVDPSVYEAYTRQGYPKTFAKWGAAGVRRIDALRKAAAETVARNPSCDRVMLAELSDNQSSPPSQPKVFVDCENGQRFYLGPDDVNTPVSSQTEKGARLGTQDLVGRCTEAVRARLNFPSTMNRNIWSISQRQAQTLGNWVVEFDFKAENAFGRRLPASARCVTTPEGETDVTIVER